MVDIARQAEVRIHVELAARRDEEIIALVLDPVQPADRRQLRRAQLALIVTDADAVSPAGEARRQRRLNAAAAILGRGRVAELVVQAAERKRVVEGKSVAGGVDIGGRRTS